MKWVGFPIEAEFKNDDSSDLGGHRERTAGLPGLAGLGAPLGRPRSTQAAAEDSGFVSATATEDQPTRPVQPIVEIAPVRLSTGRWSRWIAIAGGFGYSPIAPGTAGSFAGVLVFWLIGMASASIEVGEAGLFVIYGAVSGSLLLLGIHAASRAEIDFGRRDDGRIVIDEVVGQLITLVPLVPVLWLIEAGHGMTRNDLSLFFFEVVTGFVLFRLFDVWKPGAIGWAERRFDGGFGVMADDVMAGLHAGSCLFVLHTWGFEHFYSMDSIALTGAAL